MDLTICEEFPIESLLEFMEAFIKVLINVNCIVR